MPEVPDTVDDAISALPDSPTTEEVFEGTLPFSTRELASSATKRALAGGGSGGSSPVVYSGSLATDPATFAGSVVVDVGGPALVVVAFQPTILAGGGASFGVAGGDVGGAFGVRQSYDGVTYTALGGPLVLNVTDVNGFMSLLSHHEAQTGTTWRYVEVATQIADGVTGDDYAGPNSPVMTGTYTVTATLLT